MMKHERMICLLAMLAIAATSLQATDLLVKLPEPPEMAEQEHDEGMYEKVLYNIKCQTVRPLFCKNLTDNQIKITIYENDLTAVYKQFTIEISDFDKIDLCSLGDAAGDYDDGNLSILATDDVFNDDDLVEVVFDARKVVGVDEWGYNEYETKTLVVNENGEKLAEIDGDLGRLLDPRFFSGRIVFSGGYCLPERVLPVVKEPGDVNGDTEVGVADITSLVDIIMRQH